jgi:protein-tyrosine kinase
MSKIFEALRHAKDDPKGLEPFADATAPIPSPEPLSPMSTELDMGEEMIRLHQRLDPLLPGVAKRVVQFIASGAGEGTSTVAREFARVAATRFGKLVLLLDSGPGSGYVLYDHSPEILPSQVDNSQLYRAPRPAFAASLSSIDGGRRSEVFWKALRQRYELVVVDSPPATASADGLAICGKVDGVVLVVEAERTRWPVAQSLRNAIVRSGGNVIGVVLNRRKFYIPNFIYRRL